MIDDYYTQEQIDEMINEETELRKIRWEFIIKNIPDILDHKSILYIGANKLRHWFLDKFENADYEIDIVEIYQDNCKWLLSQGKYNVCNANILNFNFGKKYDIVFWYHGIEHVLKNSFINYLPNIKNNINKLAIFGCPYGKFKQDEVYNNENEKHISEWSPNELINLGLQVAYYGKENDVWGADLISWIRK